MPRPTKKIIRRKKRAPTRKRKMTLKRELVYPFKRQFQRLIDLTAPDTGNNWYAAGNNSVVKTFAVSLATLTSHGEFQALFKQYKINYLVVELYPTHDTTNLAYAPATGSYPITNSQIIVNMWRARAGIGLDSTFTNSQLLQIQNKKTFMTNSSRPIKFKMYLNQLSERFDGDPTIDSLGIVKSKYISTTRDEVTHYGHNIHLQKVDESAFTSQDLKFKAVYTVYFTCKQVQ